MRYSSDNQTELSIEYQDAETRKWCDEHGYTIIQDYIDRSYIGTNDRRPEFQRMIQDIQSGEIECDVLVVYEYSRLSRDTMDAFCYLKILRDCRVDVVSITEPIDKTSDFAILQQFFIFAKNAQDSIDTGRRVMSSKRRIAANKEHCGGLPPLGFCVNEEGLLEVIPEEAALVRLIFTLTRQGRSYNYMAKYLNDKGYRTKKGSKFTYNSFNSILHQVKYIGIYRWNRSASKDELGYRNTHKEKEISEQIIIEDGCPQIIPKKLFYEVQALLKSRAGGKAENKSRRHYMLGGMNIIHCAECGRAMVGTIMKSHGLEYEMYSCPNHKVEKTCSTKDIRADFLNPFVAAAIVKHAFKKENIKTLNRLVSELDSTKELRKKKKRIEGSIEQVLQAIDISCTETLLKHLKKLEYERDSLDRQIKEKGSIQMMDNSLFKSTRQKLINYIYTQDSPEIRELIQETVGDIRVGNDEVTVELKNVS